MRGWGGGRRRGKEGDEMRLVPSFPSLAISGPISRARAASAFSLWQKPTSTVRALSACLVCRMSGQYSILGMLRARK